MVGQRVSIACFVLTSARLLAIVSSHAAAAGTLPVQDTATICYRLEFAPWRSGDSSHFAKAPVGLVSPLPDTIALTHTVTTVYGRAYYLAWRAPADSGNASGLWSIAGADTIVLELPSGLEVGLRVMLHRSGDRVRGQAWIAPARRTEPTLSDDVFRAPWTDVSGSPLRCPAGLRVSPPGA